jgi:hypothetical protein
MLVFSAGALAAKSPFNVDFFCGWSGYYRPMEWTPIEVGIQSDLSEAFQGSVIISAKQDGLNTMNVCNRFVLTPDIPQHIPLVTKFAFASEECTVKLLNERGRTKWSNDYDLWNYSNTTGLLRPVNENDLLIGMIGSKMFGLAGLSNETACRSYRGTGKVYLGDKIPRMVPWDWTGFASLDLLILYNPDWMSLNSHQLKGISEWVSNGGKMLIVLGSNPLSGDSRLSELLPFEINQAKEVIVDTATLAGLGLEDSGPERVVCRPLVPKPGARIYKTKKCDSGECLFATAYSGFGRVGVLAFDPFSLSGKQRAHSSRFWVGKIKSILEKTYEEGKIPATPKRKQLRRDSALTNDSVHPDRGRGSGGIVLTVKGLKKGSYRMTSYHNNPFRQHSPIDIHVNAQLKSSDNPQSSVRDDNNAAAAVTEFDVAENGEVIVEFLPVTSEHNQRAVLNGFELEKVRKNRSGYKRILAVDIGASRQDVARGFIDLGHRRGSRLNEAVFDSSDGLASGINISLKPENSNDTLQFNASVRNDNFSPGGRDITEGDRDFARKSLSGRSIVLLENVNQSKDNNVRQQYSYDVGRAQLASNSVMEYLYGISELRPLSIWWVILILGLLALLLGPIDYKVLKRLDRLPLTWVTSVVWIIVFTVGAYYGVQYLRGGRMQFRVVSIMDGIKGQQTCWSTVYSGLFAPRSDTYELEPLRENQWWSGVAPEYHVFYRQQSGSRNIYCLQEDGGNLPSPVPVNIWTMQCLLAESPAEQIPFEAVVSVDGDKLTVNIVNKSRSAVKKGYVLAGKNKVVNFSGVGPQSSEEFSGRLIRSNIWEEDLINRRHYNPWDENLIEFKNERAFRSQGILQRTQAMEAFLEQGAVIVCVEYEDAESPFTVKDKKCEYSHIKLVRQVIFPD